MVESVDSLRAGGQGSVQLLRGRGGIPPVLAVFLLLDLEPLFVALRDVYEEAAGEGIENIRDRPYDPAYALRCTERLCNSIPCAKMLSPTQVAHIGAGFGIHVGPSTRAIACTSTASGCSLGCGCCYALWQSQGPPRVVQSAHFGVLLKRIWPK